MNCPLDQSRLLEVGQPGGEGRRADISEPAPELVESDRPMVGDQAEQPERITAADELRQWSGRTQTVGGRETRSAAARRGDGSHQARPRQSPPPVWQSQSAELHSP